MKQLSKEDLERLGEIAWKNAGEKAQPGYTFPDGSKVPEYTFDKLPSRAIFIRVAKAVAKELGFQVPT